MVRFKTKKEQVTTAHLPLVAVDLGSSSFKLLTAEPTDAANPDGSPLTILAAQKTSRTRCVEKGVVKNSSEASYMIREAMLFMSNTLHLSDTLPSAFTLLGGKSLRCTTVHVVRNNGFMATIKQDMLDEMRKECFIKIDKARNGADLIALDARPAVFNLDDAELPAIQPGMSGKRISATYSTFYGASRLSTEVVGAFERAGKSIEATFARPSALLEALASEQDELVGVAIIDMGAETTTISIYKGGQFLSCQVAPFGGHSITKDIQQLGISLADAEKLKMLFGNAFQDGSPVKTIRIRPEKQGNPDVLVTTEFLSTIITSRLQEMLLPIFAELRKYESELGQVYITGGASQMKNMLEFVQEHTALPVAYGDHSVWLAPDTDPRYFAPEYAATIGCLLLAAKYRREHPDQPLPGTKVKPNNSKLGKFIGELFINDNDDN